MGPKTVSQRPSTPGLRPGAVDPIGEPGPGHNHISSAMNLLSEKSAGVDLTVIQPESTQRIPMAPTICSEKESQVRRIMRRRSSSSSVISYVGKITHRRTVTMRNASSKLASSRLSEKLSSCESDSNEDSIQSKMDLKDINDSNLLDNSRSSLAFSEISSNQDCSERFTPALTPDSGYMTPLRNEQIFCDANLPSASRIVMSLHEQGSSSCVTSPLNFSEAFAKTNPSRKRRGSKGLLGIAIKTIKLIKRNQLLQEKLAQLQFETRAFIESVMANPENRALRDKMETSDKSK